MNTNSNELNIVNIVCAFIDSVP
uniref:Uncharacterized protein n=1 Tax=Arundo donax TaxID=35708 RepID=A0A0A8YEA9_ARUDO